MNKTELVAAVAEKTGLTKKMLKKHWAHCSKPLKKKLQKTKKYSSSALVLLKHANAMHVPAKPQTGGAIEIPAATVPAFKAGKAFKDMVNAK